MIVFLWHFTLLFAGTAALFAGTDDADTGWCIPSETAWSNWRNEINDAVNVTRAQMRHLLLPLAITCAIGVAIAGTVPDQLMSDVAGPDRPLAIPAAALLGIPVYLPTETLAPLGWALKGAGIGIGIGATFAFMIAAASLSLPEFALLARILQLRLILGLIATISLIVITGALLVPLISNTTA